MIRDRRQNALTPERGAGITVDLPPPPLFVVGFPVVRAVGRTRAKGGPALP